MATPRAPPRATNVVEKGVEAGPLRVFALRRPKPGAYALVNVTSASATPVEAGRPGTYAALSPFRLRTVVETPRGSFDTCVENAWQFSKVYAAGPDGRPHVDAAGAPTEAWWAWARAGWARRDAVRFPMGRGARPLYSVAWRRGSGVSGAAAAAEAAGAPEWLEERLPTSRRGGGSTRPGTRRQRRPRPLSLRCRRVPGRVEPPPRLDVGSRSSSHSGAPA
ncbi:MAG: hypothetical protein EBU46_18285, partial [Nitrosomonadaceae bacterium]|nr:hypothetical protein [Nitrosomonadaceae bacterium]